MPSRPGRAQKKAHSGNTLHDTLRVPVRRVFPTAVSLVRHERLTYGRRGPTVDVVLAAFDAQGRCLLALRPEELPGLHDALSARHGHGLLSLTVSG